MIKEISPMVASCGQQAMELRRHGSAETEEMLPRAAELASLDPDKCSATLEGARPRQ